MMRTVTLTFELSVWIYVMFNRNVNNVCDKNEKKKQTKEVNPNFYFCPNFKIVLKLNLKCLKSYKYKICFSL